MRRRLLFPFICVVGTVGLIALTLLGVRIYASLQGPPLEPWHTLVPHELSVAELDRAGWTDYLAAEKRAFAEVRAKVTGKLDAEERIPTNRYFEGSPIYPGHFQQDWNRSFVLEPDGPVRGAVVLLHGLTDSPYSLRHVAKLYAERGFVSIGLRLPEHGTVPGALTSSRWERWLAATRLAMREARRRAGADGPIHLVGYSNGAALALMCALDALDNPAQPRADRIVLLSPMVGITVFARFAGLAGLPAILPAFAKTAWLGILPEYNPFKYNSFPVNAARQSYELTQALQGALRDHAQRGALQAFPPVLTFQSLLDETVRTSAVLSSLHSVLPEGRSELVLFDLNHNAKLDALLRPTVRAEMARLMPAEPRDFRVTILTNASPNDAAVEERTYAPRAVVPQVRSLGLFYPRDVFSLSHIAIPFPMDDGLYGMEPSDLPTEDFGIHLGSFAGRGERGSLIMGLDVLVRMTANPFMPYLLERIGAEIAAPRGAPAQR